MTAFLGVMFISLTGHSASSTNPQFRRAQFSPQFTPQFLQIKEGFSVQSPGRKFLTAWDQTYALTDGNEKTSTISGAVLVHKKIVGNNMYLGFLTSGHSLDRLLARGPTSNIKVYRDIRIVENFEKQGQVLGTVFNTVVNTDKELGYFMMHVPATEDRHYEIVPFSFSCSLSRNEKIFLIGFPGVFARDFKDQQQKIMAPNLVTKRASDGLFVGEANYGEDQSGYQYPLSGTTADAMEGSSGGPALNSSGHLVGVLVGSRARSENRNTYQGSDTVGALRAHSFITSCDVSKSFAAQNWFRFQKVISSPQQI
ncbi:MAG: trypsin-like peptidase domain-containing protein [Pseudobdellovibrionaceae bacterium]